MFRHEPRILDARYIFAPVLRNYDEHVENMCVLLRNVDCVLVYTGPTEFRDHVRDRSTYACSIRCRGGRMLRDQLAIMIGSRLDVGARRLGMREFPTVENLRNTCEGTSYPFEEPDIATSFFLITGRVVQIPYFFTNDPTNTHVVRNSTVRCYSYDHAGRGRELSYHADTRRLVVVLNDGTESEDAVSTFFDASPYPVDQEAYMLYYLHSEFDIDHIANKQVLSPGELVVRNVKRNVYRLLATSAPWSLVRAKAEQVRRELEHGNLYASMSKKTLFVNEVTHASSSKMVTSPNQSHREIGANGEVYSEKNSGCFREVSMQVSPMFPYMSRIVIKLLSNKVKNPRAHANHPSYLLWLCALGMFETKQVGRTHMMVRDTYVSTVDALDPTAHARPGERLYALLKLRPCPGSGYYVVVNEASVPVTEECFYQTDLHALKRELVYVEAYRDRNFVLVRYKSGVLFKRWDSDFWVTPRDRDYWTRMMRRDVPLTFDEITSFHVDLNPFFMHNVFPKNVLAFNALKNAVLATDEKYSRYFMETASAYTSPDDHEVVCPPVEDGFSPHFAMQVPRVTVAYMSFLGNNQEDSIVVRDDLRCFDCFRFYTVRVTFETTPPDAVVVFHPMRGRGDVEPTLLGTVVAHAAERLVIVPHSIHVRVEQVSAVQSRLHFSKSPFRILQYDLTNKRLTISVDQAHAAGTGDKLCSFHGQKGVMRRTDAMPRFDHDVVPDLLVNPYSFFRMTGGQFWEAVVAGGGRDASVVRNSDGLLMPGAKAFYGRTFYFPIAYWASEHIYAPRRSECTIDKILGQAVKGRSRGGGMRLGNMELFNGLRANGIAASFEEKFIEHSDRTVTDDGTVLPRSALLCREDAKFFKCDLNFETEPCIQEEEPRPRSPIFAPTT